MIRIAEKYYYLSLLSNRGKKCLCACKCNIRYLFIYLFSPTVPGLRAPYIIGHSMMEVSTEAHGAPWSSVEVSMECLIT